MTPQIEWFGGISQQPPLALEAAKRGLLKLSLNKINTSIVPLQVQKVSLQNKGIHKRKSKNS